MARHGGRADVRSAPGEGSTFVLSVGLDAHGWGAEGEPAQAA